MKSPFSLHAFALCLLALSAQTASASTLSFEGSYRAAKEIAFLSYDDEAQCESDSGRWISDTCVFKASDDVAVKVKDGAFRLSVSTVGNNGHQCDFSGRATLKGKNTLVAQSPSEEWDALKKKLVNRTCVVTAIFPEDRSSVRVVTGEFCSSFCGSGVMLDIEKALRD